jgi:elongation factor P
MAFDSRSLRGLTEVRKAAKFQGCLRLRFLSIGARRQLTGVDLRFSDLSNWNKHMAMPATQIRRGMVLVFQGDPCRVVEFRHHTPGNLRAMVQAKLKNLRTGNNFEHRFRAADTIEKASMETHDLEFMYQGGETYHFMNTENYDQMEIEEEVLGDNAQWMQSGMKIQAEYYDGRVIGIQLPNSMVLAVVDTAPVMKTATKTASTKPAKLENGVTINVPEFVNTGEKVRVNPNTGEYMDRSK